MGFVFSGFFTGHGCRVLNTLSLPSLSLLVHWKVGRFFSCSAVLDIHEIQRSTAKVSVFVNQRGRICMRVFGDILKAKKHVRALQVGDWIEMVIDLESLWLNWLKYAEIYSDLVTGAVVGLAPELTRRTSFVAPATQTMLMQLLKYLKESCRTKEQRSYIQGMAIWDGSLASNEYHICQWYTDRSACEWKTSKNTVRWVRYLFTPDTLRRNRFRLPMVSCLLSQNPQQNFTMGALAASQIHRCATVATDCTKEAAGTGPAAGIEACAWAALCRCAWGCWNMLEQVPVIDTCCVILYDCMILCDVVWYCMILYDVVWYCMILCDVVWYCMILYDVVWYCKICYAYVIIYIYWKDSGSSVVSMLQLMLCALTLLYCWQTVSE